jgi:DNA polymerase-3 subunit alpha
MATDFVHLHLHTHYSMLDGACTPAGLAKLAQEYDMNAAAITDHGYVGGAEEFHRTFKAAGLNGIVGCEAYVSPTTRFDKSAHIPHIKGYHLVLLCEDNTGYHNLCKLISEAYRNGIYYKPRMDKEILRQYHEGIIALSACIGGEIPSHFLENDPKAAERALDEYLEIFGEGNFYIELMDHGMPEEKQANAKLIELARRRNVGLVATNDVHYMKKEDAEAHEIMLCIQTGTLLSDENHMRFSAPEFYYKTPDEMAALFKDVPEAIANTRVIADRCTGVTFDYKANHYPIFYMPDGDPPDKNDLRELCAKNLPMRYGFSVDVKDPTPHQKEILERMEYELGIIEKTGFISYFFVVSDFIRYAKEHGVPVGPGRGSGAGSLVAYLSLITDIDPLRYNLLFERFLNPERVSPPDFDIDFCEKRRGEVIEYVRQKYGFDSVAQICTYGQLKAKAVVKDVARVLGLDFETGNKLTKMIPDDLKMTIDKAIEQSPDLKKAMETDPRIAEVIKFARPLEGLNRQAGVHAAGVIIGDQRLDNLVPLSRSATGDMVVQYTKGPCEELGLLKMDFLGLRTLTIIRNALDLIKQQHGVDIDPAKIPLDDEKTFDMLRRGDTIAVFQLESTGMQNLCRNFGVDTVEHIIALVALYRPGPMQFMEDFINRKKGLVEIVYDHPKMEPYLKETYGIMLYQEQIMQVVQALAGFSLGGADILRRAIGKKKVDVMAQQREKFIDGCAKANNIPTALAEQIWEKIKMFAGYGFNKSHSAAYGIVSYQTAYLKANYPVEFMAAVMTSEIENSEKLAFLIGVCRQMGIKILPPDVNSSGISFSVDHGRIRFGLGAIKGVGEGAAAKIISSREQDGPFTSFLDFCERCGTELNSRMIEFLTRAGALDALKLRRSQIMATAEQMMSYAAGRARDKAMGQGSLFDLLGGGDDGENAGCDVPIPDIPEFDWDEILKSEKELLGFYVSGHPLDAEAEILRAYATPLRELEELADNTPVRLAGMVGAMDYRFGKKSGKQFGVMTFEDIDASCELMLYERALGQIARDEIPLVPGTPLCIEATVSRRDPGEKPRIMVDKVHCLDYAPENFTDELYLHIYQDRHSREAWEQAAKLCLARPGEAKLFVCFVDKNDSVTYLESHRRIAVTGTLLRQLDEVLGNNCYRVRAKELEQRRRWMPPQQNETVVIDN